MMIQPSDKEVEIMNKLKKEKDPHVQEKLLDELVAAHKEFMEKYKNVALVH